MNFEGSRELNELIAHKLGLKKARGKNRWRSISDKNAPVIIANWAESSDDGFRDLVTEAESRGCTWQIQQQQGKQPRFVFMIPDSSGLSYNERIRDFVCISISHALCMAWLRSKN